MKRLNPKAVARAYVKENLTPMPHIFVPIKHAADVSAKSCCGMGAFATEAKVEFSSSYVRTMHDNFGLSSEYITGFTHGFDGREPHTEIRRNATEYVTGFVDGVESHVESLKAVGLLTEGMLEDSDG